MAEEQNTPLAEAAYTWMQKRGVNIDDISQLVYDLQQSYIQDLSMETCRHSVQRVLHKREVQHAVLTGIQLDLIAENGDMIEELQPIVDKDEGLYGVDEIIALAIVNIYGSIGLTNYGYLDKVKPGILQTLNEKSAKQCHTFLDDITGAIAAAASSRIAHDYGSSRD
ncbi:phosphatidylglycerophosphatase A [Salsuginibacillus halophilus]|uniref:Phosphatidylglycerophosphatase A n=1 Tax=Salsuginibacillus halophilus TaxID=517424 RepID=A0A2P8HE57_9BACI|nr:phosphatidylglycerophosphatase A [Salsuginibacillus halophilus]PSL44451.1 phosphatidylglycerophosphatase A [Salsuginibacillus halophilus]